MSFPMSNGRFSDSDIDDFSSDSESDLSVNCNYDRPIVAGELQTFALNAALVTDITSPNDEAKEYVEGVAQEWFQDEDSDSGSDDWTSYQRDIGLNKTEQAELKSGSEGKTVPDSSSTREQLEYKFNPLNDTSTEIHNETDPTQENSDLKINHKIKKIAPKKPVDVDKSNEKNEEKSPQLNRQFNSVSPKKRAINQNIVIENKSLALSLDGQLDRNLTTICQQKEDDDEGISSDNDSKKSDQFNHQPKGTVLTRKDTYLKREFRPKSEACLNTLTQAIKDNNLYTSNLSLNSVSLSVQSFMSEGKVSREKQNSVDSDEGRDEIKNLDKKPNFAFIRTDRQVSSEDMNVNAPYRTGKRCPSMLFIRGLSVLRLNNSISKALTGHETMTMSIDRVIISNRSLPVTNVGERDEEMMRHARTPSQSLPVMSTAFTLYCQLIQTYQFIPSCNLSSAYLFRVMSTPSTLYCQLILTYQFLASYKFSSASLFSVMSTPSTLYCQLILTYQFLSSCKFPPSVVSTVITAVRLLHVFTCLVWLLPTATVALVSRPLCSCTFGALEFVTG
ncbi:hypothetical protein J6590_044335 [Homalodisca vitripennis]|nr:hypothetical protein J6590_044335 [Homalodisca vitripennis]